MEMISNEAAAAVAETRTLRAKIFGVGGAGMKMLERIARQPVPDVSLAAVNADAESLATTLVAEKISVESKLTRGLGTGGDPERGRQAAGEFFPTLKEACAGAKVVFIIAGLGGGAGTGISPVLARAAKESGALVLAFVTLPFDCEGNRRKQLARDGLEQLKAEADGVICLPNQKILKLLDEKIGVVETFKAANEFLADGVMGVWRLMSQKGLIEIQFGDLSALLRDHRGESCFATAEAAGATRSREALDKLLAHPMLDGGKVLPDSQAVLVSLTAGPDLTMTEVDRVMEHINGKCANAQVIMGAVIDETFRERLAITLIAARGFGARKSASKPAGAESELTGQLLDCEESGPRPQSRIVPPAPEISAEKAQQFLLAKAAGSARAKKAASKWRQGQLQLEIISKGRFDKSEPTLHRGEDLDVPTYIRRGVALN